MNKEVRSNPPTRSGRLSTALALAAAVGVGGVIMTDPAMAQATVDVTSVTDQFAAAETGIGTIAGQMLGAVAVGIAVKWVIAYLL